jgi:hypothetical protein
MLRVKRLGFNLLAGLSLLSCVGCLLIWASSLYSLQRFYYATWFKEPGAHACASFNLAGYDGRIYLGWDKSSFSNNTLAEAVARTTRGGFHYFELDASSLGGMDLLGEKTDVGRSVLSARAGARVRLHPQDC